MTSMQDYGRREARRNEMDLTVRVGRMIDTQLLMTGRSEINIQLKDISPEIIRNVAKHVEDEFNEDKEIIRIAMGAGSDGAVELKVSMIIVSDGE